MKNNRAALKTLAKRRCFRTVPSPVWVGAVYVLVQSVLDLLTSRLSGYEEAFNEMARQYQLGNFNYAPRLELPPWFAIALIAAIMLMGVVIHAGFVMYTMKVCQDEKAGFKNLLDGFTMFVKVVWLDILSSVLILLWTLLLIVPGIIASFRYRLALYVLIDNPELSALDCLRRSGEMMDGHKLEMFVLDLSFLGWSLLTALPYIGLFISIWVTPYTQMTYTSYYLALRDGEIRQMKVNY